jgi:hypothetical protein
MARSSNLRRDSFRAVAPVLGIVQVGLIGHARLRQRRGGPLSTSIPGPLFGALRQCFVILGNPEHHFLVHCVSDRDEQLRSKFTPESEQIADVSAGPLCAITAVAAASAEIRVLQKKGTEFLMQSHQLPDILLDFDRGMDHGPIVSGSDEREKGEQILKSLRTQCLPQCL